MAFAGMGLVVLAGIAMLVFGIQILVRAFKTSIGWGLASVFIPLAVLVFVFKHWQQVKTPFLRSLACVPVYAAGFALMIFGGAGSVRITSLRGLDAVSGGDSGPAPVAGSRAETATLVLRTVDTISRGADHDALAPCSETSIGTTMLTPKALAVCSHQSDPFEKSKTRLDWNLTWRDDDFFDVPLTGQWGSWLLVTRKDTGEYVDLVAVHVEAIQDGRINLVCHADRSSNLQRVHPAGTTDKWKDECKDVAENLGHGRFVFNWNRELPAMRFVSSEGPALELKMVSFE